MSPRNMVRLGEEFVIPRAVEWDFEGELGDPNLAARFEYRDGRPQCVDLRITAKPDGRPLRTSDLQWLEIDKMVISAFTRFAMQATHDANTNVTQMGPVTDERRLWRVIDGVDQLVKAPGRAVSVAELERVAEIYLENADGDPTAAVETQMGYKRRTAERRIKAAEEAGLLPPTLPGKRRINKSGGKK